MTSIVGYARNMLIIATSVSLTACLVKPQPASDNDLYKEAKKNVAQLFSNNTEKSAVHLTYEEALARGVRYNYDYRIKLVNNALQAGQLRVAEFTMFPDLKTTTSLYTRNNDFASFGITAEGQNTGVLNSTPRTLRTAREGFTWNILDFGMGYVRAKQQSERVLIAQEESRKQLQLLAQDIRIAYWKAYSAQRLLREAQQLQETLNKTENNMQLAIADDLVPKEDILRYRNTLLSGDRQLIELTGKLDKAIIDLKRLIKLPLDAPIDLAAPPSSIARVQNLENLNFKKLDTISLIMRPELRSQDYSIRIARHGVKAAILQAFPGITLNQGWNYNSNKFLINNIWIDKSIDVSWSLLNLASLPSTYDAATTQIKYEELKSMALTLAVLTQTRYAYSQYVNLAKEYSIVKKQAENAEALYKLTLDRNLVSMASKQEVVNAKLQAMIAKMDRDLILADLSTALGELYLSAGFDVLPIEDYNCPLNETLDQIQKKFDKQHSHSFTAEVNYTYNTIIKKLAKVEEQEPRYAIASASNSIKVPSHSIQTSQAANSNEMYDGHPVKQFVPTHGKQKAQLVEVYDGRPVKKFEEYGAKSFKKLGENHIKSNEGNSELVAVLTKSIKKSFAAQLIRGYQHYASATYQKFVNSRVS